MQGAQGVRRYVEAYTIARLGDDMSKSYKHSRIIGNVRVDSEKEDKRRANRKLRRKVHAGELDLSIRDVSDTWSFDKDGKHYWKDNPMRK